MFTRVILRPMASCTLSALKISKASATSKQWYHYYQFNQIASHTIIFSTSVNPRFYSQHSEAMTVDFEHVQKAISDNNVLIVDVREPDEIKEHGKIPNSINIPLGSVTTALNQMSDQEFEKTYKRPKPKEDTEIIFYCMIGKRSGMAQDNAQKFGYTNTKNYVGSFTDWAERSKAL